MVGEKTDNCPHGKKRGKCRECRGEGEAAGGEASSGICEHNRQRYICRDCGGTGTCEHERQRYICNDCGGICVHNYQRSQYKECGGTSICEHNRIRSTCKDCEAQASASMTARGTGSKTARASSARITARLEECSVKQSSRGAPKIKSNLKAENKKQIR